MSCSDIGEVWVEPWYYGILTGLAHLAMWGGLLPAAAFLIAGLNAAEGLPDAYSETARAQYNAMALSSAAWAVGLGFGSLVTGCATLVGLDAARHCRATPIVAVAFFNVHQGKQAI
jgi:hypothetical protein